MTDDNRRRFLRLLVAAPLAWGAGWKLGLTGEAAAAEALLAASTPSAGRAAPRPAPTPECGDNDEPTPEQTEGPFYTPKTPRRTSLLEPGMAGTRIAIAGRVFSRTCRPVSGAMLDFWQAGDDGEYDNEGFRLRGHQFADSEGRWRLETVVPGLYPGRTRHIHVRVQPPAGSVLSSQLYFPNEPRNRRDGIFHSRLLMAVSEVDGRKQGRFNFVLDID
ncbi:MAG: intradiol ring-cleavage dioxygenase [Candidatus Eisenbacteria bacterium]